MPPCAAELSLVLISVATVALSHTAFTGKEKMCSGLRADAAAIHRSASLLEHRGKKNKKRIPILQKKKKKTYTRTLNVKPFFIKPVYSSNDVK